VDNNQLAMIMYYGVLPMLRNHDLWGFDFRKLLSHKLAFGLLIFHLKMNLQFDSNSNNNGGDVSQDLLQSMNNAPTVCSIAIPATAFARRIVMVNNCFYVCTTPLTNTSRVLIWVQCTDLSWQQVFLTLYCKTQRSPFKAL
jgi:hypothetical protein